MHRTCKRWQHTAIATATAQWLAGSRCRLFHAWLSGHNSTQMTANLVSMRLGCCCCVHATRVQVVWNTQCEKFASGISGGSAKVPTLHLVFHDSTGATLVVQWRDGKMEVLDNPLGVFANDPLLQENLKVGAWSSHKHACRFQFFFLPCQTP